MTAADDLALRFDPEQRALWHLELLGCWAPDEAIAPYLPPPAHTFDDFDDDQGDDVCWECSLPHDFCECHVGAECGRWRNGSLTRSCTKAGSEECDFECPYRETLFGGRGQRRPRSGQPELF